MQGDEAKYIYILTSGRVKLQQVTPTGQQIILRVLSAWQLFGGVALLGNETYPVSAQAVEDSQALAWDTPTMNQMLEKYPLVAQNVMRWMTGHVKESQDLFRQLATERVERRIAHILLRLAQQVGREIDEGILIDFPLSRQDLAEMSATTLYTVSRTLSLWEKDGLVETGRERVVIRKLNQVERIAEDLPE